MIKTYLEPLIEDKQTKERLEIQLRELRNKWATGFFILNGIFVIMIVVLQTHTATLGIPWFCDSSVEPLGFTFLIMFGTVMLIQMLGMITHRLGTFQHLMSITHTPCGGHTNAESEDILELARTLGRLADDDQTTDNDCTSQTNPDYGVCSEDDDTYDKIPSNKSRRRRTTIHRSSRTVVPDANANFNIRLLSLKKNPAAFTEITAAPRGILKRRRTTTSIRHLQEVGILPPDAEVDKRSASQSSRSKPFGSFAARLSGRRRRQISGSEFDNPGFASGDADTCGSRPKDAAASDGTIINEYGSVEPSASQYHMNVGSSETPQRRGASVHFRDDESPTRSSVDAKAEVYRSQADSDADEPRDSGSQHSVAVAKGRRPVNQPTDAMTERLRQQGYHIGDEVGSSQQTFQSRYDKYKAVELRTTELNESTGRKQPAFSKHTYGDRADEGVHDAAS